MKNITNGEELKQWRKENHLTQQELADQTGYSKDWISKIETKKAKISERLNLKIEKIEEINPPANPIAEKLTEIDSIKKLYPDKVKTIEDKFIDLLTISKSESFESIEAYLDFIGVSLNKIKEMSMHKYIDKESFREDIFPLANEICKAARTYLKSKEK